MSKPDIEVTFASRVYTPVHNQPQLMKVEVAVRGNMETIILFRTTIARPLPMVSLQTTDPMARAYVYEVFDNAFSVKVVTESNPGGSLCYVTVAVYDEHDAKASPSPSIACVTPNS